MDKKETILITGGAGFIGSHCLELFLENNYLVVVVDNLSSGNMENANSSTKFYNIDIKSNEIESVFKENKIDYILHLAAQPNVGFSTREPMKDAEENILGSINIFNFAKKYNVKKIIIASTAAVYGTPEYLPVDETHSTTFLSFYGLSKFTMEQYLKLFGIDYIIFRFANVYGERQNSKGEAGVVAIFTDKMCNGEEITITGDGEQTRDFVYVKDIAQVCLLAFKSNIKNELINVSTNTGISINDLFAKIAKIINYTKKPIYVEDRSDDIKHSVLNNEKCSELFGFVPKTSLEDGLSALLKWRQSKWK